MPPVRPFHASLYLSLAVAVAAVGVAGADLLPEIPFVAGFSLLLLGAAYALEDRWRLSLKAANLVGLGLAGLLGLWGLFQVVRPPTGLADTLPWPASALPFLAPVLMILIPAKLFRPKHVGDYWAMHGLGLLAMALACAMAMDGVFVVLFLGYAAAFVWSLAAFALYRELGPAAGTARLAGGRFRGLRPAAGWAAAAGAAAVPLFWATPRTGSQWELALNSRGRAVTGLSDGPMDLNRTGPVEPNPEKAFEVYAETPDGRPVPDLPADQRWRAQALHDYDGGRWSRNQYGFQSADRAVPVAREVLDDARGFRDPWAKLPDLGPGTVRLTFAINPKVARTLPLADPVAWRSGRVVPAATRVDDGVYRSWVARHDGSLDGVFTVDPQHAIPRQYVQAWAPPDRPNEGPVMRVLPLPARIDYLLRLPRGLPHLRAFGDRLVERLVATGALPPAVLADPDPVTRARPRAHHEAIARALERHLAASGEYAYTLDLTRQDRQLDPTEDFLLNTRAGHCQRFATALALLLRSQGIPAQVVTGYRGCEARGDGWYDVREDQAHAWVEVLVPAPGEARPHGAAWDQAVTADWARPLAVAAGGPGAYLMATLPDAWKPMRWLTLDPTPAGAGPEEAGPATLFGQAKQRWDSVLKALLLAYNRESREEAAAAVQGWLADDGGWAYAAAAAAGLAGLWAWRRARRRAAAWAGYPDYVRRLGELLGRAGYAWRAGVTARENAAAAAAGLAGRAAGVADVPARVVAAYYAERFGGRPPTPAERRDLLADLRRLAAAV